MSLTDTAIRKTKPTATVQKLRDGGGLYLLLRPEGGRWWRWDYRRPVTGKRNTLSLGTYAATVWASMELAPLQSRMAMVNEWIGEEVITFTPFDLLPVAT